MVRHLTRPYFLEPCGSKMLLWRCYNTKEASWFRSKVPKMILAETDVEDFNTFTGCAVSFKHMLWTCFKVISQNCEKRFTIFLCNSWSLLDFCHFFLILLSWLRNFVQSQQQKNKIKFGSLLRGGVVGGSVGASSFGWFLGGFGWFLLVEGDFGWFQVVCCFSSYISVTAYRTLNSLWYSCWHVIDWDHSIFLFKVKKQEKNYCCPVA